MEKPEWAKRLQFAREHFRTGMRLEGEAYALRCRETDADGFRCALDRGHGEQCQFSEGDRS